MHISINEIFGWMAACFSIIAHFLSIKESILLYRAKSKYTLIPFYLRIENIINYYVNCSWFIYAFYLADIHLIVCNSIGSILYLFWIVLVFLLYFRKINCFKYFLFILISLIFIPCLYFMFEFSLNFSGKLCATIYIISFFSSILVIKEIITTKDYRIVKIGKSILKLLEHSCWFIYGFIVVNLNIVIPHVIGFIMIFISSFFWNIYKKKANLERLNNRSVEIMRNRAEFTM